MLGVNGQDGSYLAENLLDRGYSVVGWIPRIPGVSPDLLGDLGGRIEIVEGALNDQAHLDKLFSSAAFAEVYNLAAPSSPAQSWSNPVLFGDIGGLGVARILQTIRQECPETRFLQASSSEICFGSDTVGTVNEKSALGARNPYGAAKLYAHWMVKCYRKAYALFACSAILFSHESPRRGEVFVTRKITRAVARIKAGLQARLCLGDLDAKRDWGYAGDYVEAMWRMIQAREANDYVIASGAIHSVREFCDLAFHYAGLPLRWEGKGKNEKGIGPEDRVLVEIDPRNLRPTEVNYPFGDPSKAIKELGWRPRVSFSGLVEMMVDADMAAIAEG